MANAVLNAEKRETLGKGLSKLRQNDLLPAVIYGKGEAATAVQFPLHATSLVLNRTAANAVYDIELDGATVQATVQEIQRDMIRGDILHVDFLKS